MIPLDLTARLHAVTDLRATSADPLAFFLTREAAQRFADATLGEGNGLVESLSAEDVFAFEGRLRAEHQREVADLKEKIDELKAEVEDAEKRADAAEKRLATLEAA